MLTNAWAVAWASALLPGLLVGCLGGWVGDYLRRAGVVDQPDYTRRLHAQPTPRGGGLLVASAIVLVLCIQMWVLGTWGGMWPLGLFVAWAATMGWLEDIRPRPIRYRLLGQFGLALGVAFWLGALVRVELGPWLWENPWLWTALGVVALVWLMNLHNFMDGSDGLAASQGVWSAACYALLFFSADQQAWGAFALATLAGYGGFLVWNRPVAKLFMGDSGSLLLGTIVGIFAYQAVSSGAGSLANCLMISAIFVVDATTTLLWRISRGQRWYTAHAAHAFQRLIAAGLSHAQVLGVYMALNLGLVLPLLIGALVWPKYEFLFGMGLIFVLVFGWWRIQRQTMNLGLEG